MRQKDQEIALHDRITKSLKLSLVSWNSSFVSRPKRRDNMELFIPRYPFVWGCETNEEFQETKLRGWFYKHSSFVSLQVSAQMRGKRGAIYTTFSLHLAQTWCETNEESLKNQPLFVTLRNCLSTNWGYLFIPFPLLCERLIWQYPSCAAVMLHWLRYVVYSSVTIRPRYKIFRGVCPQCPRSYPK